MAPAPSHRYSPFTQCLHWLTAILVLVAFVYGPGGSEQRVYLPARDFERHLHETLGLAVLALTLLRVLWRLVEASPPPLPMDRRMVVASKAVQGLLYLLLLLVPLSAVAGAWLEGHAIVLLGGVSMAPPLAESHALGAWIAEAHGWLGDTILWLAGAHAAAAIYHQAVLKDGVLATMLPAAWAARLPGR